MEFRRRQSVILVSSACPTRSSSSGPRFLKGWLPGLTRLLGRRRGWIVATQVALLWAIGALSTVDFARDIQLAAMITLAIAFFAASQDIVIDAYRVEALEERQLGAGAATIVFGYRIGQVGVAALGLVVASVYGWAAAFILWLPSHVSAWSPSCSAWNR